MAKDSVFLWSVVEGNASEKSVTGFVGFPESAHCSGSSNTVFLCSFKKGREGSV